MSVEYDLREKPNPKGDNTPQPLYPRFVSKRTISTEELIERVSESSSFTKGDVEGMLNLIANYTASYIREGYTVQLGEIGYFSGSLKATHAVMDKKDIRATSIYLDTVNFRASKWLKQHASGMIERAGRGHSKSADIGKEERLKRLNTYLDKNMFISRTQYTYITGLLKNKALAELKQLVDEGVLIKKGRGSQMVFIRNT